MSSIDHVTIRVSDLERSLAFYAAALAGGGRDIGAPGIRAEYSPGSYGGFVLDRDGNNIEAVWHQAT